MSTPSNGRQARLAAVISEFLSERLNEKREKLPPGDPKCAALAAQFHKATWLEDAARRVSQIQAVTHSLKPMHPDARGTSLRCMPDDLPPLDEVGSRHLGKGLDLDVVGNAAALDVYKFLRLRFEERSLLDLAAESDADLGAALSDDPATSAAWMTAFSNLTNMRGAPASHTYAKQLYWPASDDVHDDAAFQLLAPLYPTSLVHRLYKIIEHDRFSDEAKEAREARRNGQAHPRPIHEYPNLAIQKLGGTKPQNISQLNSERRGDNLLLASLPPSWRSADIRPLLRTPSLFRSYGWQKSVQANVDQLRRYLEDDPARNVETRRRRDAMVDDLLEELIWFGARLRTLEPGWSHDADSKLPATQRRWLDPDGEHDGLTMDNAIDEVANDFAEWLNRKLGDPLPMGDPEYDYWRRLARFRLRQIERETVHE